MARDFIDDISVNTIVGPGAFINGGISSPGFMKIDGDVNGDLISKGRVIISETARVRGNIRARSVMVGGIVQGDIIAPENVKVLSSGMVLGAILTKRLNVEENVVLNGFCYAVNDQAGFEDAEKTYKNKQALAASAISRGR